MTNEKRLIDANELIVRMLNRREGLASAYSKYEAMPDNMKGGMFAENLLCALMVSDAPTVDAVEVVHGDWRLGKCNAGKETVFAECSVCDAVFEVSSFSLALNYNYCPNCGAKMNLEKE